MPETRKITLVDDRGNAVAETDMPPSLPAVVEFPEYFGDRATVTHVAVEGAFFRLDSPVVIHGVKVDDKLYSMTPRLSLR